MPRRLHTPKLFVGNVPLDAGQARHAREVLRLDQGTPVEIFDDQGTVADGILQFDGPRDAFVRVEAIRSESHSGAKIIVAAAVPKGERADWMVEKLSELGVYSFIPLSAERSVVLPEGRGKRDRWVRIATESAKQSRRAGVMRVEELAPLKNVLGDHPQAIVLSTGKGTAPLTDLLRQPNQQADVTMVIGPEGGWSEREGALFAESGLRQARLTETILRIETAAIAAAVIAATTAGS